MSRCDGLRLRCCQCTSSWGVRHGSVFAHSYLPLPTLIRLTHAYWAGVTPTQAATMYGAHRQTISGWYGTLRECIDQYMKKHPIVFPADEIVEIDECHLQCLQQRRAPEQKEDNNSDEPRKRRRTGPKVWIIGCIGRDTGLVALDMVPDHQTATIQPVIDAHLPHQTTICLADKDRSFMYLRHTHTFYQSEKRKPVRGNHLWVKTYQADGYRHHGRRQFDVHTNYIEGYWAHFRKRIGNAHADMINILLSECMFRSLKLEITYTLRV